MKNKEELLHHHLHFPLYLALTHTHTPYMRNERRGSLGYVPKGSPSSPIYRGGGGLPLCSKCSILCSHPWVPPMEERHVARNLAMHSSLASRGRNQTDLLSANNRAPCHRSTRKHHVEADGERWQKGFGRTWVRPTLAHLLLACSFSG